MYQSQRIKLKRNTTPTRMEKRESMGKG